MAIPPRGFLGKSGGGTSLEMCRAGGGGGLEKKQRPKQKVGRRGGARKVLEHERGRGARSRPARPVDCRVSNLLCQRSECRGYAWRCLSPQSSARKRCRSCSIRVR